jgi:hypothetical protein
VLKTNANANANKINSTGISLVAVVVAIIIPMLLLSASLGLPVQIAKAKAQDKKDTKINANQLDKAKKINIKQVNQQDTNCKNGDCPATASNVICLRGAVCHFGYDENPLLISTPH